MTEKSEPMGVREGATSRPKADDKTIFRPMSAPAMSPAVFY